MSKQWKESPSIQLGTFTTSQTTSHYFGVKSLKDWTQQSVGNPGWWKPRRKDIGGPFQLVKTGFDHVSTGPLVITKPVSFNTYSGELIVNAVPSLPTPSMVPLDDYGAEAYNRMKPTAPSMDLLNALVELRELPMLLKQTIGKVRTISDYYVAVQFGWLPLLSDIRKFIQLQITAQKRLNQLIRDAEKPVRREIQLLGESSMSNPTVTTGNQHLYPTIVSDQYQGQLTRTTWSKTSRRIWASARFRYWLPPGPRDVVWRANMLRRIYGLSPTPSVVYNAIPWTWLIDWFSSVGDVIENLESGVADRLAADYFYLMETIDNSVTVDVNGKIRSNIPSGGGSGLSASVTRYATIKRRIKGDPFGFNTATDTLSGMQLSILGALGFSRLKS